MQSIVTDLKYSLRALSRAPGSALIAVLTLGLGIGLCTTTFSLLYGVLGRGMGVPREDRVVRIYRANLARDQRSLPVSQHDFYDWRERQRSFEDLAAYTGGTTINLSDSLGPERFEGAWVTANLFDLLQVRPVLGGTFRPGDDAPGAALTVVLGHQVWTNRYGGDSGIVGRAVKVNGEHATVLGVMPPGFEFSADRKLWVALRDDRAATPTRQGGPSLAVVGRLRDGITREAAEAEFTAVAGTVVAENPAGNEGVSVRFATLTEDNTGGPILLVFGGMQVATFLVLLIACANVANLLLARATLRTGEAAVRTAIGASPFRMVLPFLSESFLLAAGGAILGTAIAWVGIGVFDGATSDVGKPTYMVFALDGPALLFVVLITVLTALLAGAAPAWQILRTNLSATLKDESRGTSGAMGGRTSRALVVAQMAFSCALLVGAGLMIKSVTRLRNYQYPFATENVLTARVQLPDRGVYADTLARRRFFEQLLGRVQALPGVAAAALTSDLPGAPNGGGQFAIEGASYQRDEEYPRAALDLVSPGFFDTFEVPVTRGRAFTAEDRAGSLPVAIINQAMAAEFFPGEDPIGRRIRPGTAETTWPWLTIVGVAPDIVVVAFDPDGGIAAEYYVPVAQRNANNLGLAARVAGGDPLALVPAVRQLVRSMDPDLPLYQVASLTGLLKDETWFFRVFGTLFIVFGAAALFMASVGLYGVLSFSVSRRVREMGIRMALGASARDVVRLVLRQSGWQAGIGLALGLGLAFALSRVIGVIMFDVDPDDPLVFLGISLVIALVALAASWVPARRATAVDPIVALRYE